MKKHKLPTVSIVIATYNAGRTIRRVLDSIRSQDYPSDLRDVIVVDGGSRDETQRIAAEYGAAWYNAPRDKQNAEYNKSIGVAKARGDILFLLDHDNILPNPTVMRRMVQPFLDDPKVVGVETLRYHYDPRASLLDRYFALFGAGDPVAWYLGKADRLSYLYDRWVLFGEATDRGDWIRVEFDPNRVPTLGANGCMVRREILVKHADVRPGHFFHIDVHVDLIRKGYNTYGFIKDGILHLTGYNSLWAFLRRRKLFLEQFHLGSTGIAARPERRYSVYEQKDKWRLVWFVTVSLAFVVPAIDAWRGYRKVPDVAWFLHPFLCFGLVVLYSYVIIVHRLRLWMTGH
ncbi:glycosyltransferase family 2 protein [Candidatus Gottesmanbacteria bacterium]|nr:glycosyltransferase family 2 protein [Candidatus Gottesmanbacteria bacterium]